MTIGLKAKGDNTFLQVETESTDVIDIGGFSDSINTVSAKTAKFSGGGIMQANSGLKIGLTNLKINSGTGTPTDRPRSIESSTGYTPDGNTIDDDLDSLAGTTVVGSEVIVDFTTIDTAELFTKIGQLFGGGGNETDMIISISDDNISYTQIAVITVTAFTGNITTNYGTRTWRYVKIFFDAVRGSAGNISQIFEIFETPLISPSDTVTVRVRSSVTQDTADGTVLISDQVMAINDSIVFDTDLLLTGTDEHITLEIVSFSDTAIAVTLDEITSIKEI